MRINLKKPLISLSKEFIRKTTDKLATNVEWMCKYWGEIFRLNIVFYFLSVFLFILFIQQFYIERSDRNTELHFKWVNFVLFFIVFILLFLPGLSCHFFSILSFFHVCLSNFSLIISHFLSFCFLLFHVTIDYFKSYLWNQSLS